MNCFFILLQTKVWMNQKKYNSISYFYQLLDLIVHDYLVHCFHFTYFHFHFHVINLSLFEIEKHWPHLWFQIIFLAHKKHYLHLLFNWNYLFDNCWLQNQIETKNHHHQKKKSHINNLCLHVIKQMSGEKKEKMKMKNLHFIHHLLFFKKIL